MIMAECPVCLREVSSEATRCEHCGATLTTTDANVPPAKGAVAAYLESFWIPFAFLVVYVVLFFILIDWLFMEGSTVYHGASDIGLLFWCLLVLGELVAGIYQLFKGWGKKGLLNVLGSILFVLILLYFSPFF